MNTSRASPTTLQVAPMLGQSASTKHTGVVAVDGKRQAELTVLVPALQRRRFWFTALLIAVESSVPVPGVEAPSPFAPNQRTFMGPVNCLSQRPETIWPMELRLQPVQLVGVVHEEQPAGNTSPAPMQVV